MAKKTLYPHVPQVGAVETLVYFGFERQDRSALPELPAGIMVNDEYYLLIFPSPNVRGAGMYRKVTLAEFIGR